MGNIKNCDEIAIHWNATIIVNTYHNIHLVGYNSAVKVKSQT